MAYTVVSWMLLQVADVTFDRLPIPENSMTVLIALVVIGFPVVAVLAWAYELTARGIVRHEDTGARAPRLAFLPFVAVIGVVALGSGFLLYYLSQNFWESPRRSIAVLPFTNSGGEAETEILQRRAYGGDPEPHRSAQRVSCRCHEHQPAVQGQRHGRGSYCKPAGRGSGSARQRAPLPEQGERYRPPDRRQRRPGTLVRYVRPRIVRYLRHTGGYCPSRCAFVARGVAGCRGKATEETRHEQR